MIPELFSNLYLCTVLMKIICFLELSFLRIAIISLHFIFIYKIKFSYIKTVIIFYYTC